MCAKVRRLRDGQVRFRSPEIGNLHRLPKICVILRCPSGDFRMFSCGRCQKYLSTYHPYIYKHAQYCLVCIYSSFSPKMSCKTLVYYLSVVLVNFRNHLNVFLSFWVEKIYINVDDELIHYILSLPKIVHIRTHTCGCFRQCGWPINTAYGRCLRSLHHEPRTLCSPFVVPKMPVRLD